ncbi:MAG: sulfite exporter TauE/SafE family protein [Flavobacteriales bacterium]
MGWELLGYAGAVLMGLSLGLLGGGGSILTVPILVYLFGQDPVTATGLSLFIVGTTSAAGIFSHHKQGNIEWRTAAVFGAASMVSVFITRRWLVPALPDPLIHIGAVEIGKGTAILGLFAIVMLLSAWSMIKGRKATAPETDAQRHLPSLLLIGLLVGLLTGVLGAGGGFLIVPSLVLLAGVDMKRAIGTSLLLITVNSYIGFLGDQHVHLADHAQILLPFLALAVLGIVLGTRLSKHMGSAKLRPAFGWFVLAMGTYIIVRELYALA